MPTSAQLLQTAATHHQAGRLKDAENAYLEVLKADADHADALRLLGGLYLQTGQLAKAVACLEKAVRLRPQDPETRTNLGVGLRGLGRADEAIDAYKQALAINPDYVSALNNLGSIHHESGRFPEAFAAYGQVLRLNPDKPSAHFNYGNSLMAAGRGGEALGYYEQALKLKPDYVEAMVNLGMALGQAGKGDQSRQWLAIARSWFDKALKANPENTVAMNNIANVLRQEGKPGEAVAYYRAALRLRPDYVSAAINLATSLRDLGRLDEAIDCCRAALRLKPDSVDALINLGVFLHDLSRHEEAVAHFDQALACKPSSIDAQWNKAFSLLALGRYVEGFALHEVGLGVPHMRGAYPSPGRRWQGEPFAGKRLLIQGEQGLGDTLQFIRYAALCKERGGEVIVLCPPALRPLLRHCPAIDALAENVSEDDCDFHAAMMSLPFIFGTTIDTIPASIPYLHVGAAARAKWANKITGTKGLKVGLVWAGNPRENQLNAHMIDRRRSMSLTILRPLFDIEGAQFYTLQIGASAAQIDLCGLRGRMIDLMPQVEDFEDTAAIVERLDLVIAVDTSVVHLAGGLGKPVWVMSRFDACWRWLQNRPGNPWYPTARIFGQQSPGDWLGVVEEVKAALIETVKEVS